MSFRLASSLLRRAASSPQLQLPSPSSSCRRVVPTVLRSGSGSSNFFAARYTSSTAGTDADLPPAVKIEGPCAGPSAKVKAICSQILELNVVEVAQLAKLFQTSVGLSDSDLNFGGGGGGGGGGAAATTGGETKKEEVKVEKTQFDLKVRVCVCVCVCGSFTSLLMCCGIGLFRCGQTDTPTGHPC